MARRTPHLPTTVGVALGAPLAVGVSAWATAALLGPLVGSFFTTLLQAVAVVWWLALTGAVVGALALAGHGRRTLTLTAAAVVVTGGVAIGLDGVSPRAALVLHLASPEEFFADHRADFDRVAAEADPDPDEYYGSPLPDDLAYLSTDGNVVRKDSGELFLAQWYGIPDDGGGYIHSSSAPFDVDMAGDLCIAPVELDGDWWACGLD